MSVPDFRINLGYGPNLAGGPVAPVAAFGSAYYESALYTAAPGVVLSCPASITPPPATMYPIMYISFWLVNAQPNTIIFQIDSPMQAGVCVDPTGQYIVGWIVDPHTGLDFWGTNIVAGLNEYYLALGFDEGQSWVNGVGGDADPAGAPAVFVPPVLPGGADWQVVFNGSYIGELWVDVPPAIMGGGPPAGYLIGGLYPAPLGGAGQKPNGEQALAYFGGNYPAASRSLYAWPLGRFNLDGNQKGIR